MHLVMHSQRGNAGDTAIPTAPAVVFFALIQMIYGILVVVFSEILSKQDIDLFLEQISSTAKQYLVVLVTVTIIEVVGIAVLAVATTLTCKHKLNLE